MFIFIRFHPTTVSLFIKLGVWSVVGLSQILDFMNIHMDNLYVRTNWVEVAHKAM